VSYHADLYDVVTPASVRGDLAWYRRLASERGGPVLELGSGTGRITLALARDGIDIHALDADSGMLERLRRKLAEEPPQVRDHVSVIQGDMRRFQFADRFPLIIAPFRAFLHNLTEQDQIDCLLRVREHLRSGGSFAFNVFHPSLGYMAQNAGALAGAWRWVATFDTPDGGSVVRSEATRYDTVHQRLQSQHRFDEFGPDGALVRTSLHRLNLAYLYPADIHRLLHNAGFKSVRILGNFEEREFEHDEDELAVLAVAP
jgi:SAM-dependent methyltransferase